MTTILGRLKAKIAKIRARSTERKMTPEATAGPVFPNVNEIVADDDFELTVFRDHTTNGIVVRMGNSVTGKSIVVTGEAVMHAAAVVEKTFDAKKNADATRSLQ